MKRPWFLIAVLAFVAMIADARSATAQVPGRFNSFGYYGLGYYSYGPRVGPWFGPGLWGWSPFYSGAIGNFWSNGLSLYGPPVPTQGPIPGSFGGSDSRALYYGNSGYSLFWLPASSGVYGASRDFVPAAPPAEWRGPRFATRDVRRRYEQDRASPQSAIDRAYRDVLPYAPRR